jgi:hypothetical protein
MPPQRALPDTTALWALEQVRVHGRTQRSVAAELNVSEMTISNLVSGRMYRDLHGGRRGERKAAKSRYRLTEVPERRRVRVAQFWAKVQRRGSNECWPFGDGGQKRYGHSTLAGGLVGSVSPFVAAYTLANRLPKAPRNGAVVIRHLCDFKPCCNPAHLVEGTHAENQADRQRAEREGRVGPCRVSKPIDPPIEGWSIEVGDLKELKYLARKAEFWANVERRGRDECWLWIGKSRHKFGYGHFRWYGKEYTSHRLSWALYNDIAVESISSRTHIRHRCPNGPVAACCNPRHLAPGSAKDNRADTVADGRVPSGEAHHYGRATSDATIRSIREDCSAYPPGTRPTFTALGVRYGVSSQTIKRWLVGTSRLDAGGPMAR